MTKSLFLLLLFPVLALSQGSTNDYLLSQKPASGPLVVRPVTPAVGRLLGWPASINTPAAITLGTSLSITGTTLNAIPAWGDLTGIPAAITTLSSATAAGLALMDDADAAAQRTTLGLGTLATQSGTFSGTSSGINSGDITITDTDTFDFGLASQVLTGSVRLQMSLTSDASGIKLSGDSASPGNSKVYGTDGSGTKGWYAASGDMTKSVYDPRGLNTVTGLPGTNDGAQTGGLGGQLSFVGGNAGPSAGEDGGAAGGFESNGGIGTGGLTGGSGGSVSASAYESNRGGNVNTSASSFLRGGDINTSGGGDINTSGTGSIGLGATGTRTTLNGAASSDWTLTLPTGAGTNGQVLQTNGSGTTSWATVSSGLTIGTTAITGGTSGRLLTSGTTVGELTLGTGVSTFLGTPTLANFNTALSDADVATTGANTYTGLQQFSGTTHAGLRLNNLTTAERDALTGAAGMAVWNTTDGRLQLHNGSGWTSGMVRLSGDTMTGALAITQGTANTGILTSTGYSLTGSNATPMIDLAGTWNTSGTPTAIKLNITNTASNSASSLIDVQSGGTSRFKVLATGGTTLGGGASSPLSIVSSTGTVNFFATGDGSLLQDKSVVLPVNGYVRFGFVGSNDPIITGASSSLTISQITSFQLGANTATNGATAPAQTIKGPNATGTTSTGGSLTLAGGTGTSAGGEVIITTAATTTQTERARFSSAGVTIGASGTAIASVISNTATLDFPSTSSHDASALTITVTGAAVGDVVAIGIPNGSVGTTGVFFGWVSAADTVTIRYCNTHNGGAVDPASGTFRATVIKH